MGKDNQKPVKLFVTDNNGILTEIDDLHDVEFSPIIAVEDPDGNTFGTLTVAGAGDSFDIQFTATRWTKCKTRKRFVKLMNGAFGIQRNVANMIARDCIGRGCPSYEDMWADCYAFFIKYAAEYLAAAHNNN